MEKTIEPKKPVPPDNRSSRGIPWIILATLLFVTMDAMVKELLNDGYQLVQVVWGRYFFHFLLLLIVFLPKLRVVLSSKSFNLQILRSILLLMTTSFFFCGLQYVPLAEASAIMLISPLIVTALAMPILKEPVGPRRWMGVAIGFVGALIIIRPGSALMSLGILFPMAAAISFSIYQISTRLLSHTDRITTTVFYTALVGTLLTSTLAPFHWTPAAPEGWALMIMTGICGGVGHFSLIKAFTLSPASVISPYSYLNLIWALLFGYLLFSEFPNTWSIVGAVIITGSGLYVYHRERNQKNSKHA